MYSRTRPQGPESSSMTPRNRLMLRCERLFRMLTSCTRACQVTPGKKRNEDVQSGSERDNDSLTYAVSILDASQDLYCDLWAESSRSTCPFGKHESTDCFNHVFPTSRRCNTRRSMPLTPHHCQTHDRLVLRHAMNPNKMEFGEAKQVRVSRGLPSSPNESDFPRSTLCAT